MLIRVSGGRDGIKDYLENGHKEGREHTRDELDQRLILGGNLELTNDIIQGMSNDGEKYLHITLSFKEDKISDDLLKEITEAFKQYTMNAYGEDEFNFYAEAHIPKIKSYINKKTGEDVERKPHIHFVLPKQSLLSGNIIEPVGEFDKNVDFFKAFQESINQKYGLASPVDNRRTDFTSLADVISRYKGDDFRGGAKEVKELLCKMIVDKDINTWQGFKEAVGTFGAVKIRNTGHDNEYLNVTLNGASKGINFKDSVFSRNAIEQKSIPTSWIEEKMAHWKDIRSHELKHIVKSSESIRHKYYGGLNSDEKKNFISELERKFQHKHRENDHVRYGRNTTVRGRGRTPIRRVERSEYQTVREQRRQPEPAERIQQRHTLTTREIPTTATGRCLRDLPQFRMVSEKRGNLLLLSRHDATQLEKSGAGRHLPVRRGIHGVSQAKNRLQRKPMRSTLPVLPRERQLVALSALPSMKQMKTGRIELAKAIPVSIERPVQHKTPLVSFRHRQFPKDTSGRILSKQRVLGATPSPVTPAPVVSFKAHSLITGLSKSQHEETQIKKQNGLEFYKQIRLELDATRLLSRLSQTHGLLADKYTVSVGKDGADRISCGSRNYNVSDFLTKEMNLEWKEASRLLRTVYQTQRDEEPQERPRHERHKVLWSVHREQYTEDKNVAWKGQMASEKQRRAELNQRYQAIRSELKKLPKLERAVAQSVARMEHVSRQAALRIEANKERDELKTLFVNPTEHYRSYLVNQAQHGNVDALAELQRHRTVEPMAGINQMAASPDQEHPYLHDSWSYRVERNGDVSYLTTGNKTLFVDKGHAVSFDAHAAEREQIELGLRLAVAKFGGVLKLEGTETFKAQVVEVAAQTGMKIDFKNEELNASLEKQKELIATGRAAFSTAEKALPDVEEKPTLDQQKEKGMDIEIDIDRD